MADKIFITVEVEIKAPIANIWRYWTEPEHIKQWYHAADDWYAPSAENKLKVGGTFKTRMEAKDGSMGFDFGGVYTAVEPQKRIEYAIGDGRRVKVEFWPVGEVCKVVEIFEAETINSLEMQKGGWQAILNSFKKYVQGN